MAAKRTQTLRSAELAARLREAREHQGLSQLELSRKAGLGKMTASDIEAGRRNQVNVGIGTVERLAGVLGVPASWLAYGENAPVSQSIKHWLAPGFDPLKMIVELSTMVNGAGGHIEQSYKYLDAMDAANWCAFTKHPRYASFIEDAPIKQVSSALIQHAGRTTLDVIALGVGTGRHEARLLNELLERGFRDLQLFLLDISQPLLSMACQQLADVLTDHPSVSACAMHGNFHHLASYASLFERSVRRRRLVCMFGPTFGNFDNEIRFVRNSLSVAVADDLLLLDVALAHAPAAAREQVLLKDPMFANTRPAEFQRRQEEFNIGPLRRYMSGLREIMFERQLDTRSCVIPGTYALDMRATAKLEGGATKQFSVAYVKRYDPDKLAEAMRQEGWNLLEGWRYGDGFHRLCLFRRER